MSAMPCGCDPEAKHTAEQCREGCISLRGYLAADLPYMVAKAAAAEQVDSICGGTVSGYCNECGDAGCSKTVCKEERRMASREGHEQDKAREGSTSAGNGAQQGFATGATRSTDAGKVDFEGHINPEVLAIFGEYMNRHRYQRDGRLRASDNWQAGIPIYRYVKSLIRHTFEFWRMWRGTEVKNPDSKTGESFDFRDVLCAILFNTMGLLLEMKRAHLLDCGMQTEGSRKMWERQGVDNPGQTPSVAGVAKAELSKAMSGFNPSVCCGEYATCKDTRCLARAAHESMREEKARFEDQRAKAVEVPLRVRFDLKADLIDARDLSHLVPDLVPQGKYRLVAERVSL